MVCRGYGSLKNRKDHLQARGAASRAELILLGTNGVCPQWRKELTANTVDAAFEKHVPVIEQNGDTVTVKVGSVEHPSMPEHYIEWILLETEMGFQIHYLKPGNKPEATFKVNEKVIAAYEYCNLHGLWKADT